MEELFTYMDYKYDVDKVTVKWVMSAYESIIKKHLLDTSQNKEDMVIKIMDGITLERKYISEKQVVKVKNSDVHSMHFRKLKSILILKQMYLRVLRILQMHVVSIQRN